MILGVTGHRPSKLGGYDRKTSRRLEKLALSELTSIKPTLVLTGMALGWDQAIAEACIELKIPFKAMVPFHGQEKIWPGQTIKRYYELLGYAADVVFVCSPGYASWKLLARNRAIVDLSDHLLALFDGGQGGTAHCVHYAVERRVPITNCWERYNPPESIKIPIDKHASVERIGPSYLPINDNSAPF